MTPEEEIYLRQTENHLVACRDAMNITAHFATTFAQQVDDEADKKGFLEVAITLNTVLSLLDGRPVTTAPDIHDDKPDNARPDWLNDPKNDQVLGYNPADGGM